MNWLLGSPEAVDITLFLQTPRISIDCSQNLFCSPKGSVSSINCSQIRKYYDSEFTGVFGSVSVKNINGWKEAHIMLSQQLVIHELNIPIDLIKRTITIPFSNDIRNGFNFKMPINCKNRFSASYQNNEIQAQEIFSDVVDSNFQGNNIIDTYNSLSDSVIEVFTADLVGLSCSCCCHWLQSYEGQLFSIRHKIEVVLSKGWFFNYSYGSYKTFKLFKSTRGGSKHLNSLSLLSHQLGADEGHVLKTHCVRGFCSLTIPTKIIDVSEKILSGCNWVINGVLNYKLVCDTDVQIKKCYLVLLRSEFIGSSSKQKVVAAHFILGETPEEFIALFGKDPSVLYSRHQNNGNTAWPILVSFPISHAAYDFYTFDTQLNGLLREREEDGGESLTWNIVNEKIPDFQTDFDRERKSVSSENEENIDNFAVRYYLRLVVEDTNDKVTWNTTEVYLYSSRLISKNEENVNSSLHTIDV